METCKEPSTTINIEQMAEIGICVVHYMGGNSIETKIVFARKKFLFYFRNINTKKDLNQKYSTHTRKHMRTDSAFELSI